LVGTVGRIILKLISQKLCRRFWPWLTWLRIGTTGWLLWTRWWIFWPHEVRGFPWMAEEISGFEVGQCCMEFRRTPLLKVLGLSPIRLPRNRDYILCMDRHLSPHKVKTQCEVHTVFRHLDTVNSFRSLSSRNVRLSYTCMECPR
jgi:hypothetical protein